MTPSPTANAAPVVEPRGLTITSPNVNNDEGTVYIHGSPRTLTLTGTAPTGSVISLYDGYDYDGESDHGTRLASVTTTSTTFTLSYTFAADAPYDQFLEVGGVHGKTVFDSSYFDAVFDAPTSATPTLDTPASGTAYEKGLLPFGLSLFAKPVDFTGTGTPGDEIELTVAASSTSDDESGFGGGLQTDEIVVADDGTWSGSAWLTYGDVSVTASQVQLGGTDSDREITVASASTNPIELTTTIPAGTVLPPTITKPAYPTDEGFQSVGGGVVASSTTPAAGVSSTAVEPKAALRLFAGTGSAASDSTAIASTNPVARAEARVDRLRAAFTSKSKARVSPRDEVSVSGGDDGDGAIADDGSLKVTGTATKDAPGYLTTTVAGTGTPGDDIVLSLQSPKDAEAFFTKLYPKLFAAVSAASEDEVFPVLSDDPGTVPSLLPADDHSIRVGADGKWTTTVTLKPGSYLFTDFAVSPSGTYSVAADLLPVTLVGKPYIATASDPAQLAFTGSNSGPEIALALAALATGGALLVAARRRRRAE
ncbi:hypothetical protein GCM10022256_24360 [Frondihabitans peucedani]|uniref:Gram-positive cocci surface proteins LPxTG domain-containing protein n=1 Tax=Frondihabitans peucedani TaxID=598626 RepID=A0ABP8E3M1_9MICO